MEKTVYERENSGGKPQDSRQTVAWKGWVLQMKIWGLPKSEKYITIYNKSLASEFILLRFIFCLKCQSFINRISTTCRLLDRLFKFWHFKINVQNVFDILNSFRSVSNISILLWLTPDDLSHQERPEWVKTSKITVLTPKSFGCLTILLFKGRDLELDKVIDIQSTLSKADIVGTSCKCPPYRELMWSSIQHLWRHTWNATFIKSKIKRSVPLHDIKHTLQAWTRLKIGWRTALRKNRIK